MSFLNPDVSRKARQEAEKETPVIKFQFGGLTGNIPLKILSKASERVRFS